MFITIRNTLTIAAIAALVPAAALAADGTFDKTLHVSGQVMLSVSTGSGYVHVSPGSGTEVHIVGHVHANGWGLGASADDRVKQAVNNPPIDQSGNTGPVYPAATSGVPCTAIGLSPVQFALANGVPVDLDVVLDGCHRAIDDLDTWAEDDVKEPLLRLREELLRMQGEQ